jgi:bifunctional non-homologous end joining protein LigD
LPILVKSLRTYQQKRRFDQTPEPQPKPEKKHASSKHRFVVQKHRARNLHYDFRLEADGVLKSWAVPKGLSPNPVIKRLAMAVEDHPLDYANFEGVIPEGQYGGGTVMVWDRGTYELENGERIGTLIRKGEVKLKLKGKKLKGSWVLVRTRDRNWLLIKHRDQYASENELTETSPKSVLTQRTLAEIASQEGGNVKKAASGDPRSLPHPKKSLRRK